MSDTTKLILAIVVVVVVVAVIISLFMNARKRRELEHRRFEAGELRARIDEHAPHLQQTADRASVTGAIAADARTEAERTAAEAERKAAEARQLEEQAQEKAAEARRLEEHAQKHAAEAAEAQSSLVELERNADLIDPDVRTDAEGYRLDESGQRLPGQDPEGAAHAAPVVATGAAAAAASAPFLRDDDEPDLADAENPFATNASHEEAETADASTDSAWDDSTVGTETVDHTPHESRDDVSNDDTTTRDETARDETARDQTARDETARDETARDETARDESTARATSETDWEGSSATGAAAAAGTGAAVGWAARSDDEDDRTDAAPSDDTAPSGTDAAPSDDTAPSGTDADQGPVEPEYDDHGLLVRDDTEETVSVPALEDRADYVSEQGTPDDDPGDHRGQPWATTSGTPAPEPETDPQTGAEEGQATEGALGSRMDPSTETEIDGGADHADDSDVSDDSVHDEPQQSGPRVSTFEEVVDGGFGIGSAAPLEGGVQPLGHEVKASRDGNTFLLPGDEGYDDAQPDVWFYNEESARRAGFRKQGE
ncbi:sunset domain-containing protein [Humibacillus xanthopallidus]|uniref:Uncharacterized protein n=1 Tax=Humibacillus xanthopallidus TaxID=412689 RepID=A0A543I2G3_9MICO|nr:hypothetical protein [Humibacillus xanthopallidus]TQM64660.1 hypothetical protein FBY41_1035 [Humibacillus xanthopallidus]